MRGTIPWLRSLCFNVGWYAGTAVIGIVGAPILLLPRRAVIAWSHFWTGFCLWWLGVTVGLTHHLGGRENLPAGPAIIASKHQSSWETLAYALLFPRAAIVVKRELLFIPIVGWAIARAGHIGVERGDGARALRGLTRRAKAAIAEGRPLLIFPEGTRVAVGAERSYHVGIAALYRQLGVPVVPVALNSGLFWGRRSFVKRPGVIDVEVLAPIAPGLDRQTFMSLLHERIEAATGRLVARARSENEQRTVDI
jgi:1-acyl-sn-glycerol-3-phosphate acyltransferase